jgi:dephospho-CoA kinase
MKHVGLTGLIGSGKSLVAHIFEYLGVPVYSSDLRAKYLMEDDPGLSHKIKLLLGSDAYDGTNKLNRKFIASKFFQIRNYYIS